jgi:hypothetical protein
MDFDAFFCVQDPALQFFRAREPVNERAKSNALHNPAHVNGVSVEHGFYFVFTTQPRPCQPT